MQPTNTTIQSLCKSIHLGETVVPDFQRDFVWKPDDIHDLLVSVLGDYYIGTMLTMNTMFTESPFALRLIDGVEEAASINKPQSLVKIILDGQQRSSSLYYALYGPEKALPGRKTPFRFYLNLDKVKSKEWDQAVEFYPKTKATLAQLAARSYLIAFTAFSDVGSILKLLQKRGYAESAIDIINSINSFQNYSVQIAELSRETPLDRVVETFERINRTGLPLRTIDLLVARLYQHGIKLRELLEKAEKDYAFLRDNEDFDREFILRVMTIMRGADVRKKAILNLSPDQFVFDWSRACEALDEAYKRITDRSHYGAVDFRKRAPFSTLIVPLAAMLAYIRQRKVHTPSNMAKVDQWYWTSVFANRYNEAVNTLTSSDYNRMLAWFNDAGKVPEFVKDFDADQVDLRVKSKSGSIYRGILCLLIKQGARDFKTGELPSMSAAKLEDDHIFPKAFGGQDLIANRTLIPSNESKSDKTPGIYFSALETLHGSELFNQIMRSHLIDANGVAALRDNDQEAFLASRMQAFRAQLRDLVPDAIGMV